ncbi:uncharacterized protein LOC129002535 [Macrosteles quadrilineatus]|uniref:uncharacterized protein LOC129002535 n=1 Tax=Macrosteles quadrilineatus TaxID=74068 RepID=UPI0023E0BB91|nr:uncharacterized protein LOC129002535 [Macrosteles quadrilineatus]
MCEFQSFTHCQWELTRIPPKGLSLKDIDPICEFLKKGLITCGRAVNNTIPCPSMLSSRRHCSFILKYDGSLFIHDHNSLNGTFLNDTKILTEREIALSDGDVIGLGVDPTQDYDVAHPPTHNVASPLPFIFKLKRRILTREEAKRCDADTLVPILGQSSFSGLSAQRNIHISEPSTSRCTNYVENVRASNTPKTDYIIEISDDTPKTEIGFKTNDTVEITDNVPKKEIGLKGNDILKISDDSSKKEIELKKSDTVEISDHAPTKEIELKEIDIVELSDDDEPYPRNNIDEVLPSNKEASSKADEAVRSNNDPPVEKTAENKKIEESVENKKIQDSAENEKGKESAESEKVKESEVNEKDQQLKKKKENLLNSNTFNDEIIYIDDDDDYGELPCSQLFDVDSDGNNDVQIVDEKDGGPANVEEKDDDQANGWFVIDDINDSDSDSDAEQWFQRLSQSQRDSDGEDKEEDKSDTSQEEVSNQHINIGETISDIDENGVLCADEDENDEDNNDQDDNDEEPVTKIVLSGSKRKLSTSSEEDEEEFLLVSSSTTSTSKTTSEKQSHSKEILNKRESSTISAKLVESNSQTSTSKQPLDNTNAKERSHKKRKSRTIIESDEDTCSSSSSKRTKKRHSKSIDSNTLPDIAIEKKNHDSKHKRKQSSDSDSRTSCSGESNEDLLDSSSTDLSVDSVLEVISKCSSAIVGPFVAIHRGSQRKNASKVSDSEPKERNNEKPKTDEGRNFEDTVPMINEDRSSTDSNSKERKNQKSKTDEGRNIEETVSSVNEDRSPTNSESKERKIKKPKTDEGPNIEETVPMVNEARSSTDTDSKLLELTKKVSSQKKKNIPIIDAKPLKSRKNSVPPESETLVKKNEKVNDKKHDQWLSNNNTSSAHSSKYKADIKAYRKEKLKDLALKEAQKQQDKPKTFTATSHKTKTTLKSRSDTLLQDLSLASFKIPRRASKGEEDGPTSNKPDSQLKPQSTEPAVQSITAEAKLVANSAKKDGIQIKQPVFGVENEEPITVVELDDEEYKIKFPFYLPGTKQKSNLKDKTKVKDKTKRVKFNFPNDISRNIIYRSVCFFDKEEGNTMKPVTKTARKDFNIKSNKQYLRRPEYTDYFDETIYAVCKWNVSWFEEKDKVKKDPPVFSGQVYHLSEEFTDYKDYRREYFPLLMYELWGSLSKHFDQVILKQQNKSPICYVDIRSIKFREVKKFFPSEKKEVLACLYCQVLLDNKKQETWPRPGDLVMVSVVLKPSRPIINHKGETCQIRGGEKRLLGYVSEMSKQNNLSNHHDVSPKLKKQHPNANVVVDGFTILMRGNPDQEIDTSVLSRVKVIKNIKPNLRSFEALDRLPISPLCMQICQPKMNLPVVNISSDQPGPPLANKLNPAQKKAIYNIARECVQDTNMIHLVHGPPGCGKSEVITNIILQMWLDWHGSKQFSGTFQQILLCAPSNSAIDELVNKLIIRNEELTQFKGVSKFSLVRVGVEQSTHESCSGYTLDSLAKMELKKLTEVKADENQKRLQISLLEGKKQKLTQELDSLTNSNYNLPGDKTKVDMKQIRSVEKKLADTKAKIHYFESGKEPTEREKAIKYKEFQLEILEKANIVATTLSSCYNGIMAEATRRRFVKFNCCIVDEATQSTEPDTLIPLMLGVRKLVLVGDPKQLPATVMTSTAKVHGLEKSTFARHYDWWKKQQLMNADLVNPCHFLNIQYRMHPEIAQWPSEYFYENRLLSPELLRDRSRTFPLVPYIVLSHDYKTNVKDSECNDEEANLVAFIIRSISNHQLCKSKKISVISPYNRHKDELKRRMSPREFPNLEIGSVDSYQGRESDIVIFSCVRTEGVGFLSDQERINVALTRAKHSLIIVGNFMSLQRDPTWNSLLNNAKRRELFWPIVNKNEINSLIFKKEVLRSSL